MKRLAKILSVISLVLIMVVGHGCTRSELYPESDVQITKAEPYNILPTSNTLSDVEDGVVSLKLVNKIPCNLFKYDLVYRTVHNEPIDSINIFDIPVNLPLSEEGTEVDITLKPYTQQLLSLFDNTVSTISPVRCSVILHFKDVNKNEIIREAGFLLHEYSTSTTSE